MDRKNNQMMFNIFAFVSKFARSLIEIFISLYLFKNGFSIKEILMFYFLENIFALFISYFFVLIGEKYKYSIVMYIGIVSFVVLQVILNYPVNSYSYILLISLLYSIYRRGYWVARRFYVTSVIPQRNSSESFGIVMILTELASILAGYVGALILDKLNMGVMTIISSVLLLISVLPLISIKISVGHTKLELVNKLKEYDKRNYLAFSLFELNNLLEFVFPIYLAIYVKNTYEMVGVVNAVSNIAVILFILIYSKMIKKQNYFIWSTILLVLVSTAKAFVIDYVIIFVCFMEGIIKKMQNLSVNKIYFENRNGMNLTHYNLIYQLIESLMRAIVVLPLLFMNNIRMMILFILIIISVELMLYSGLKRSKKLN